MGPLRIAPNLALDEAVNQRLAAGEQVIHLGFGESQLPLFPGLVTALSEGARRTAYGPVAGAWQARAAVAGYFRRRGLPTEPDDVVLAPGSKGLLFALVAAQPGDVVLPAPSWVTYGPQAQLLGRTPVFVPIPEQAGGVPDPELLPGALAEARRRGARPATLVLTLPDNPTGTTAGADLVRRVMAVACDEGLVVIADEIYRDVIFDDRAGYLSPAEVEPETTVVVTGLSKSLSLGGWRIGAVRFPHNELGDRLRRRVTGVASQVWSNAPGPMQAVVEYAFSEPDDLVDFRRASTRLHGAVAVAVHGLLAARGLPSRRPTGGFYVYPDFGAVPEAMGSYGIEDDLDLERQALDRAGVALLAGSHFGDRPTALRARLATSMLYGADDDQRWEALHAADPLAVPHVAASLERLAAAFSVLTGVPVARSG
jgi:aspartate aminotransferase